MELDPGKDWERQEEEVTEEPKRSTNQEMVRGFSLFEEALWVIEAQDLNVEQYRRVAAAIQDAAKCIIYDEKKSCFPDITGSVSQEGTYNWIQQGTRSCAISFRYKWNWRLSSISYYWWSFSSVISHLLSSPQSHFLPVQSVPAPVCQLLYYTTVLFKVL